MPLLPAGARAFLHLRRLGRFEARVQGGSGETLALAVFARVPAAPATLVGAPAEIAFVGARGLHRVAAVVLGADATGLVEVAVTGDVHVDQRRAHVRAGTRLPGTVTRPQALHRPLHTYTLDVSGSGVLVAGAGPVQVGDPVGLTVRVPGADAVLQAGAHVARRTLDGHVALALDRMDPADRELLVRTVFEHERRARRAAQEPR